MSGQRVGAAAFCCLSGLDAGAVLMSCCRGSPSGQPGALVGVGGEHWRAYAWGHSQMLVAQRVAFDSCELVVPAVSLGETGAVSAVIACGLTIFCFVHQRTQRALIVSLSENGQTASLQLVWPG